MTSIESTIMSMGGIPCRTSVMGNFYAIPAEDGNGYVAVKVSKLLAKDTKTCTAFDLDSAMKNYDDFVKARGQKANAPKVKKVNADAEARRNALDNALTSWLATEGDTNAEYTATDFLGLVPDFSTITVMEVGSTALRLVNKGVLEVRKDDNGKRWYSMR